MPISSPEISFAYNKYFRMLFHLNNNSFENFKTFLSSLKNIKAVFHENYCEIWIKEPLPVTGINLICDQVVAFLKEHNLDNVFYCHIFDNSSSDRFILSALGRRNFDLTPYLDQVLKAEEEKVRTKLQEKSVHGRFAFCRLIGRTAKDFSADFRLAVFRHLSPCFVNRVHISQNNCYLSLEVADITHREFNALSRACQEVLQACKNPFAFFQLAIDFSDTCQGRIIEATSQTLTPKFENHFLFANLDRVRTGANFVHKLLTEHPALVHNEGFFLSLIAVNPALLDCVPTDLLTSEFTYEAVRLNGGAFPYVYNNFKTDALCELALSKDLENINYVPAKFLNFALIKKGFEDFKVNYADLPDEFRLENFYPELPEDFDSIERCKKLAKKAARRVLRRNDQIVQKWQKNELDPASVLLLNLKNKVLQIVLAFEHENPDHLLDLELAKACQKPTDLEKILTAFFEAEYGKALARRSGQNLPCIDQEFFKADFF